MLIWTPDEVRRVLDARERRELRELGDYLVTAMTIGRAILLRRKPWLSGAGREKNEDIQEASLALFAQNARLLYKFGECPEFQPSEHALRKYVIGVTFFVLQKKYQKHRLNWEQFKMDLASRDDDPAGFAGFARFLWIIDLEKVIAVLSSEDQGLFYLLYGHQLSVPELCERLGISADAIQQRKTRLLKRLRKLLEDVRGHP